METENEGSKCSSLEDNREMVLFSLNRSKSLIQQKKKNRCLQISRIVAIVVIGLFSIGFSLMLYVSYLTLFTIALEIKAQALLSECSALRNTQKCGMARRTLRSSLHSVSPFPSLTSYLLMLHRERCFLITSISSMGIAALLMLAALFFPNFVRPSSHLKLVPLLIVLVILLTASWLLSWTVVSIQERLTPSFGLAGSSICSVLTCLILGVLGVSVPILLITYTSST